MKADPMERWREVPPKKTASIVVESEYHWNDSDWMAKRAKTDPHQFLMAIYEVNANSWRDDVHSYRELADELVPYVAKLMASRTWSSCRWS